MSCTRCGSENSYQFEASPSERTRPSADELPRVCRDCGLLTIGGIAANLPENLEKAARDIAEAQVEAAAEAAKGLESNPAVDIESYMANFFRSAYLEGFFRALTFFKHNAKEGRLRRIRDLWSSAGVEYEREGYGVVLRMSTKSYDELVQLIHLSAVPGDPNVKSSTNKRST